MSLIAEGLKFGARNERSSSQPGGCGRVGEPRDCHICVWLTQNAPSSPIQASRFTGPPDGRRSRSARRPNCPPACIIS